MARQSVAPLPKRPHPLRDRQRSVLHLLEHHDHAGGLGLVGHQARQVGITPIGEADDLASLAFGAR